MPDTDEATMTAAIREFFKPCRVRGVAHPECESCRLWRALDGTNCWVHAAERLAARRRGSQEGGR